MAGKGKHNGPARKKAAEPQEGGQPPVEKPAAQPDHLRIVESKVAEQTGEIFVGLAEAPAKPSEEAEAVYRVMAAAYGPSTAGDRDRIEAAATALVRRFPGLTRKPGIPRHDREDALLAKRGRLPDGSIVLAVWDEAAGVWAGQLVTKPAVGLAGMLRDMVLRSGEHHATSWPGLFGLLKKLDRLFREQVARQKGGGK